MHDMARGVDGVQVQQMMRLGRKLGMRKVVSQPKGELPSDAGGRARVSCKS